MAKLDRRQFTTLGLGAAAAPLLGLIPGQAFGQDRTLRFLWWGGENRAQRTQAAIAAYQSEFPGINVVGESFAWDAYWPRLATQVAGGNAPDIIQLGTPYIYEYARRGSLQSLDEYRSGPLMIDDFGDKNLALGSVDGTLYGVTMGINSECFVYDTNKLEELGLPAPELTWTWSDYAELMTEISAASPGEYWGGYMPATYNSIVRFLRQRGKLLFVQGGMGCDVSDIEEWFEFLKKLRAQNAVLPPEIQAEDPGESITSSLFAQNKCAFHTIGSNQVVAYAEVMNRNLGLTMYPRSDDPAGLPGNWIGPSMFLSISATAGDKALCAEFINFFAENQKAADHLGVERGVPPAASIRDYLANSDLTDSEKLAVEFIGDIAGLVGDPPPPDPSGFSEAADLYTRVVQEMDYGQLSVAEAAQRVHADGGAILAKAAADTQPR